MPTLLWLILLINKTHYDASFVVTGALQVVITATCSAASDSKIGIMTTSLVLSGNTRGYSSTYMQPTWNIWWQTLHVIPITRCSIPLK